MIAIILMTFLILMLTHGDISDFIRDITETVAERTTRKDKEHNEGFAEFEYTIHRSVLKYERRYGKKHNMG